VTVPEWPERIDSGPQVESAPPGARITLDGHPIGIPTAPFNTFNTFPGPHVVMFDKPGAVIGIAGSATLAAGIHPRWRASASSAPTVGITSSGGVVAGWAAAF
jgi:hypothetical protein